jgi:hypothetical protein
MAPHGPAIAAAELRVLRSRDHLRVGLRRLRHTLSRPSFLAAAVGIGVLAGFALTRRGQREALAATLCAALIRYCAKSLIGTTAHRSTSRRG